ARVRRTPDATALVAGAERLRYEELNARANRLARHLVALGAGPERAVALALPRTADFVVALLATWKAGAGYLPVDPEDPAERIAFLLADTRAAVLVHTGRSTVDHDTRLRLDDPATRAAIARHPDTDPTETVPGPAHAAYVIYTSGSTGRPKGVVV